MKRISAVVTLLIVALFVAGGCTSDPVKDDIVSYTKAVAPVIKGAQGIEKKSAEIGKETDPKVLATKNLSVNKACFSKGDNGRSHV